MPSSLRYGRRAPKNALALCGSGASDLRQKPLNRQDLTACPVKWSY